ncbi:hypothetical protein CLOP_g12423 [Closterium sp. NIES-67]|nr:hypothetical protein CLOP_g12423 [Closterium sp. NIES-67]
MYLMTCTRPDLAYPLSILARFVATVTERVRRGIVRSITLEEAEISAHVAKIVEKQHGITLHPKTLRNA